MAKISAEDIYGFKPNETPMIVFIVLFGITLGWHSYVMIRKRSYFWWPFLLGIIFEVIGYIVKIPSGRQRGDVGLYAAQTLFILLPPALFAASIYMTLGRLLVYLRAERASIVRVRWMTGFFVTGDVLSFLMQGSGGGLQSSKNNKDIGEWVTIGGLIVQLIFFGSFVITSGIADHRLRKANYRPRNPGFFAFQWLFWALYGASILILVRSIFRIIEYAQGYGGWLMTHEVFMYVFDAALMFLVCVILGAVHPAHVWVKNEKIELGGMPSYDEMKGKYEPEEHELDTRSLCNEH